MAKHTIESDVRIISQTHKLEVVFNGDRVRDILSVLKNLPADALLHDYEETGGTAMTLIFKSERAESLTGVTARAGKE